MRRSETSKVFTRFGGLDTDERPIILCRVVTLPISCWLKCCKMKFTSHCEIFRRNRVTKGFFNLSWLIYTFKTGIHIGCALMAVMVRRANASAVFDDSHILCDMPLEDTTENGLFFAKGRVTSGSWVLTAMRCTCTGEPQLLLYVTLIKQRFLPYSHIYI